MLDTTTLNEINNLLEFIGANDRVVVKTRNSTYKLMSQASVHRVSGGFFRETVTSLTRPPYIDSLGHMHLFFNSVFTVQKVETTEVEDITINDRVIYRNSSI